MTKKKEISYQESIDQIENIINEIENEDPDVDSLTTMVEEALVLINKCKIKLKNTEDMLNDHLDKQSDTEN